jgi:riboflavin biosynthesis pyrimidine reductase
VRSLLPQPSETVDLIAAYAAPGRVPEGRPFVRCNMITSYDGAITVHGRSGKLGGPADRKVFGVLRSWADVIVVGAGTVRSEAYGPARLDGELRRLRTERGQGAVPPIAVVTRSGNLDWSSSFFSDAEARPIVVTTADCDEEQLAHARSVADVVVAGENRVEPALAFARLGEAGYRSVLLEGGPGLNADVLQAGLLDELCLSVSPQFVAGTGPRVFAGLELPDPVRAEAMQVLEEDGFFFYRLAMGGPAGAHTS